MSLNPSSRTALSTVCFALSSIWGVAGACKLLFGVRITIFFLPPLDLEQVAVGPSLATAFAFLCLGAWLGRERNADDIALGGERLSASENPAAFASASPKMSTQRPREETPARRSTNNQ